jgi:methylmalonyl-CoA/ethylmalonyl-CoA epimerase
VLGAHYVARFDPPGLAFFDFSGVRLLLEKGAPKATVYFRVEDIDAAYRDLVSKGISLIDRPHLIYRDETGIFGAPGDEEWMAFFNDPSGNTLGLVGRRQVLDREPNE